MSESNHEIEEKELQPTLIAGVRMRGKYVTDVQMIVERSTDE